MKKHGKSGRPGKRRRNMPGYRLGLDKIGRKSWLINRRPEDIKGIHSKADFLDGKVEVGSIFALSKKSNAIFLGIHKNRILYYNPKTDRIGHTGLGRFKGQQRSVAVLKEKVGLDYFKSENNWMNHRKIPGSDLKVSDVLLNPYRKTVIKNVGDKFTMLEYHETAVVGDILQGLDSGLKAEVLMITKRGMTVRVDDGTASGRIGHINLKDSRYQTRQYSLVESAVNKDIAVKDLQEKFNKVSYDAVKTENNGTVTVARGRPAGSKNKLRTEEEKQASREKMNEHLKELDQIDDEDIQGQISLIKKVISQANKAGETKNYDKYRKVLQQVKYKEGIYKKYYDAETDEDKLSAAKNALKYERKISGRESAIKMWEDRIKALESKNENKDDLDDLIDDLFSSTLEFEDERSKTNPENKSNKDNDNNKKNKETDSEFNKKLNDEIDKYKYDEKFNIGYKFIKQDINYYLNSDGTLNEQNVKEQISIIENALKTNISPTGGEMTDSSRKIFLGQHKALTELIEQKKLDGESENHKNYGDFRDGAGLIKENFRYETPERLKLELDSIEGQLLEKDALSPTDYKIKSWERINLLGQREAVKKLIESNKKENYIETHFEDETKENKDSLSFEIGYKLVFLNGDANDIGPEYKNKSYDEIKSRLKDIEKILSENKYPDGSKPTSGVRKMLLGERKAVKELLKYTENKKQEPQKDTGLEDKLDKEIEKYKNENNTDLDYSYQGIMTSGYEKINQIKSQIESIRKMLLDNAWSDGLQLLESERKMLLGRYKAYKEKLKDKLDSFDKEVEQNKDSDEFKQGYKDFENFLPNIIDQDGSFKLAYEYKIKSIELSLDSGLDSSGLTKLTDIDRKKLLGQYKASKDYLALYEKLNKEFNDSFDSIKEHQTFKAAYPSIVQVVDSVKKAKQRIQETLEAIKDTDFFEASKTNPALKAAIFASLKASIDFLNPNQSANNTTSTATTPTRFENNSRVGKSREVSDDEVKKISNSKVSGFTLKTDSYMIEDQQVLLWHETQDGKKQTGAWFKLTNEGYNIASNLFTDPASPFKVVEKVSLKKKNTDPNTNEVSVGSESQSDRYGTKINFGRAYEANIDGVLVRIWDQSSKTKFSAKNNVEVIAPGDDKEAASKVMSVLSKLGLDMSESSKDDKELLYLTRLLKQRNELQHIQNDPAYKDGAFSDDPESRKKAMEFLRKKLSYHLGIEDVTKLPKYNPEPQSAHLDGSGNLVTYRPDLELDPEWSSFKNNHLFFHNPFYNSNNRTGNFADRVRDLVLQGKGNFASALDRMRRGFTTEAGATDMGTGGGVYVYAGIVPKSSTDKRGFYWKPSIMERTDSITYDGDRFGRQIKHNDEETGILANFTDEYRVTGISNILSKCVTNPYNETLFKNTLSIFKDIEKIVVHSSEKDQVIELFKQAGMEVLPDGRKIKDIIHTTNYY